MRLFSLLIAIVFSFSIQSNAQGIRRCVSNAVGGSHVLDDGTRISCTFGQPGCVGTHYGENFIIRSGFEQPIEKNCAAISFEIDTISTSCGGQYIFQYTGEDVDINTTTALWNFGTGASPEVAFGFDPIEVSFIETGVYSISLTVTDDDCESNIVNILEIVDSGFGASASITHDYCKENPAVGKIETIPFGGSGNYIYSWNDGSNGQNLTGVNAGTYSLVLSDGEGCIDTIQFVVEGAETPLSFEEDITHETCDDIGDGAISITPLGGNGGYSFEWDNGSTENSIQDLSKGVYEVTVTDSKDCEFSKAIIVNILCSGIVIPDIFSPDDTENSIWTIDGIEQFPRNDIKIFNRWGSVVYEASPYLGDWKGTNSAGEKVPVGAYYYVLKLNDSTNSVFTGSITIVR